MVLSASFEFEKNHNKEVVERPSDDFEIPQLMKDLPYLNEKTKERPFCYPYCVKARALIHAHLGRLELSETLEIDRRFVLKRCPLLVNEMVNITWQLTVYFMSQQSKSTRVRNTNELTNKYT